MQCGDICPGVQNLRKEKGWELDARLLGYAWALQHSQDWGIAAT